jgi:hypothetical protein
MSPRAGFGDGRGLDLTFRLLGLGLDPSSWQRQASHGAT